MKTSCIFCIFPTRIINTFIVATGQWLRRSSYAVMEFWYVTLSLLVSVLENEKTIGLDLAPCLPQCVPIGEGQHLCKSVTEFSSCDVGDKNNSKRQQGNGQNNCSCEWAEVLTHHQYQGSLINFRCLQYNIDVCVTETRHIRESANDGYTKDDLLREILDENARIEKLNDENEKRAAKIRLVTTVRYVLKLIKQLNKAHNTSSQGVYQSEGGDNEINQSDHNDIYSNESEDGDIDSNQSNADTNVNEDHHLKGGWQTITPSKEVTKKPPMFPLKNDRRFKIVLFAGTAGVFILVLILCLIAKIKNDRTGVNLDIVGDLDLKRRKQASCWNTFLEKLRVRNREKAKENERRAFSLSSAGAPPKKSEKTPLVVPSKTTVTKKDSCSSLKSDAGSKADSCTMISGLTHAHSGGSDAEIDDEFRMFQTNFRRDFKSLLKVNKDE